MTVQFKNRHQDHPRHSQATVTDRIQKSRQEPLKPQQPCHDRTPLDRGNDLPLPEGACVPPRGVESLPGSSIGEVEDRGAVLLAEMELKLSNFLRNGGLQMTTYEIFLFRSRQTPVARFLFRQWLRISAVPRLIRCNGRRSHKDFPFSENITRVSSRQTTPSGEAQ